MTEITSVYGYTRTLAYDLNLLLTCVAPFERDERILDKYGGEKERNWKRIGEPRCELAWWRVVSGVGAAKEYADPEATLFFNGGYVIFEPGTEILEGDRVLEIKRAAGGLMASGPFRVISVMPWRNHVEANIMRPAD